MSQRKGTMDDLRRFIRDELVRLKEAGEKKKDFAHRAGKSPSWLSNILKSNGIYADDFLLFVAESNNLPDFVVDNAHLNVVGKVGAGGHISTECEELSEPLYQVNVESMFIQSDCVGFQVDGESMFPTYRHGDIVVAKKDGNEIASLIGQDAVVAVEGEGRFLKRIERSGKENLFNLESYNAPPMREKKILWASRVLATLHGSSYKTI